MRCPLARSAHRVAGRSDQLCQLCPTPWLPGPGLRPPDPSHPPGCRRAQCPSRSPRQRRQLPARHWYSTAGHDNWCGGCWTLGPRGLRVLMLKNTSEKLRLPKLNLPRGRPRKFQAAGKEFTPASAAFRPHLRRLAQCRVSNLDKRDSGLGVVVACFPKVMLSHSLSPVRGFEIMGDAPATTGLPRRVGSVAARLA